MLCKVLVYFMLHISAECSNTPGKMGREPVTGKCRTVTPFGIVQGMQFMWLQGSE